MKRLVLLSPAHMSDFGRSLDALIHRKFPIEKYKSLLERILLDKRVAVAIYIPSHYGIFRLLISIVKNLIWWWAHGYGVLNCKLIISPRKLKDSDVFFTSARAGLRSDVLYPIKNAPCKKVFFLSHLFVDTALMAKNAQKVGVDQFIYEANVSRSKYFQTYFSFYKSDVLVLPFGIQPRFERYDRSIDRIPKAFFSGRVFDLTGELPGHGEFRAFFPDLFTYHPVRQMLYEHQEELTDLIDIDIAFQGKDGKTISRKQEGERVDAREHYYRSFNIVDRFNQYMFFIAPEECVEVPAITAFEGMACGCCLIALNHTMYSDLGFEPDKHFISYDGTLLDLKEKITYFRNNPEQVKVIAENGYRQVIKTCNQKAVGSYFVDQVLAEGKTLD